MNWEYNKSLPQPHLDGDALGQRVEGFCAQLQTMQTLRKCVLDLDSALLKMHCPDALDERDSVKYLCGRDSMP